MPHDNSQCIVYIAAVQNIVYCIVMYNIEYNVRYSTVTVQYNTLYSTLDCNKYCTVQYSTLDWNIDCTVQYSTVQYSILLYCKVLYSTVQRTVQIASDRCRTQTSQFWFQEEMQSRWKQPHFFVPRMSSCEWLAAPPRHTPSWRPTSSWKCRERRGWSLQSRWSTISLEEQKYEF